MPEQINLGGRLQLAAPAKMTAEQKTTYNFISTTMVTWANSSGFVAQLPDGRLIGPFNAFLESPAMSKAFLEFQQQEGELTSLDERTREVVILAVGQVWNCDYERYAHAAVAKKAGLSDETIAALRCGAEAPELTGKEQLARELARSLTAEHEVDDDLYARALGALGANGIVDVIMLAGCYDTVSSLLNVFRIPAPPED